MTTLTEILNNPEVHYPGNFDTPQRANALLTGLCQDAAIEIERLQDEVFEQCRINGMSAEREDALRAKVERLNKAVADERERLYGKDIDTLLFEEHRLAFEKGRRSEREACAQVCDDIEMKSTRQGPADCASGIRARGNT